MSRLVWLIVLQATLVSSALAQNSIRPSYNLLWKISGNGLKKPSFLFGTMHLRDNKAFDFSDSVLLSLNSCESFAMEIHPDSLTAGLADMFLGFENRVDRLSKNIRKEEYQYLDSLLKIRTGLSLKNFKTVDEISTALMEKFTRKDKTSFLDAWLFGVASEQNKLIIGLENIPDQKALFESTSTDDVNELKELVQKDSIEIADMFVSMLDIYFRGNLEEINRFMNKQLDSRKREEWLTKRNMKMVEKITSHIHTHTTFIAVGAAHLPAEDGIISLLRKKGYRVNAVTPSFTGLASQYKGPKSSANWKSYNSDEGGYSIEFPGNPITMRGKIPLEFKASFDWANLQIFMATHAPLQVEYKNLPPEKMLQQFTNSMRDRMKLNKVEDLMIGEYKARDFSVEDRGSYFRMRLILRDNFFYLLIAGSLSEVKRTEDVDRFFQSFKAIPLAQSKVVSHNFFQETGAFSIQMPSKVNSQTIAPPENSRYKIHVFFSTHPETGESFLVRYNDFPSGLVSFNDSTYMAETLRQVTSAMKGSKLVTQQSTFHGFPSLNFDFSDNSETVRTHGRMIMRGNRFYLILASLAATTRTAVADEFFASMQFLPYKKTTTKNYQLPHGASIKVTDSFELDSTFRKTADMTRCAFVDRNSGTNFTVQLEKLSIYEEQKNQENYFSKIIKGLLNESDSLVKTVPTVGQTGCTYWVKSTKVNVIKQIKFLLAGDILASLWTFAPPDYTESALLTEISDSFTLKAQKKWSLFDDKTNILLEDLSAKDSTVWKKAKIALGSHVFETGDLPKLYEAIRKNYPDKRDEYNGIKKQLLKTLLDTHDSTTSRFIDDIYPTLSNDVDEQSTALGVLASLKTEKDARKLIDLIRNSDQTFNQYAALHPFYDSLQLLNFIGPDLLELRSRFHYDYNVFNLLKVALDSGLIRTEVKQQIINKAIEMGKTLRANESDDSPKAIDKKNYFHFLVSLPFNEEIKQILLELQKTSDLELKLETSLHLLTNKVSVPSSDLNEIASDRQLRNRLYFGLKQLKALKLVKKDFFSLKQLAESEFNTYATSDDEQLDSLILLHEQKFTLHSKKQVLFLYKYRFAEDGTWYTGLAGPYLMKQEYESGEWTQSFEEPFMNNELAIERVKALIAEKGGKVTTTH